MPARRAAGDRAGRAGSRLPCREARSGGRRGGRRSGGGAGPRAVRALPRLRREGRRRTCSSEGARSAIGSRAPSARRDEGVLVGLAEARDAAVVDAGDALVLVQSVDQLSALVDDPWLFGRIATVHALGDVLTVEARAAHRTASSSRCLLPRRTCRRRELERARSRASGRRARRARRRARRRPHRRGAGARGRADAQRARRARDPGRRDRRARRRAGRRRRWC